MVAPRHTGEPTRASHGNHGTTWSMSHRNVSCRFHQKETLSLVTHHFHVAIHRHHVCATSHRTRVFSCLLRTVRGNRHRHRFFSLFSLSLKSCVNWRNSSSARFSKVNDHFDNFSFYCWKLSNYCSAVSSITYIDWTNRMLLLFFYTALSLASRLFCRLSLASHK